LKVALINNNKLNMGIGRYSCTLYNYLENKCNIDHYFFDRRIWCLWKGEKIIHRSKKTFLHAILKKIRLKNLFLDFWLARFIPDKYDIYHIASQDNSLIAYYPNIGKTVITVHDIFYYTYYFDSYKRRLIKYLYTGLKNTESIIAVSNKTKRDLIKYLDINPEKISVIYPGIDDSFKPVDYENLYGKYGLSENARYILNIGRDEKRKNIKTLLLAFYKLKKKPGMEDVKLIKINGLSQENRSLLKALHIENDVKIIKNVPEKDLPKFYSMAEVFVFPSSAEGFGFPPLEAMKCGTPVVASNAPAMPEVLENSAILVEPLDYERFSEAIHKFLIQDEIRDEYIKKGFEQSSKFTWKKCAKATFKLYRKISG